MKNRKFGFRVIALMITALLMLTGCIGCGPKDEGPKSLEDIPSDKSKELNVVEYGVDNTGK